MPGEFVRLARHVILNLSVGLVTYSRPTESKFVISDCFATFPRPRYETLRYDLWNNPWFKFWRLSHITQPLVATAVDKSETARSSRYGSGLMVAAGRHSSTF